MFTQYQIIITKTHAIPGQNQNVSLTTINNTQQSTRFENTNTQSVSNIGYGVPTNTYKAIALVRSVISVNVSMKKYNITYNSIILYTIELTQLHLV